MALGALAVTDLLASYARDKAAISLDGAPTTRQVATQLGVLHEYAFRLLSELQRDGVASLVCGRWFAQCDKIGP